MKGTLIVATLLLVPVSAAAYTLKAGWPGPSPNIGWLLNNPGFSGPAAGTIAEQDAAIEAGASTWTSQGCAPFSFSFAGSSSINSVGADGSNVVMVRHDTGPFGALAGTYVWSGGDEIKEFDMVFYSGNSIVGVASGGDTVAGGGVVVGNIDKGMPGLEMALTGVDNWSGDDYWRYAIATDCRSGVCLGWTAPQTLESGASDMASTAVAAADFDGDGSLDLFLSGIDQHGGDDYWRFRIGVGCKAATGQCTWSPIKTLDSGASVLSGGGVAVAQLDSNTLPDVVLVAVDNWDNGDDYWRYRIGMNCNAAGDCAWGPIQALAAGATAMSGGGVTVADLDGDGSQEIVIFGIDNWGSGDDYWRYRIGTGCTAGSGACSRWSPIRALAANATILRDGGVTTADLTGDGRPEIVVSGIDDWDAGLDYWRYSAGTACNVSTGVCSWGPILTTESGGSVVVGGGLSLADLDGNGQPDLTLAGVDQWGTGRDYWRVTVGNDCQATALCTWAIPFSPNNAPDTFDIRSVATHEFGHATGLNHSNSPGAVMTCSIPPNKIVIDLTCDDIQAVQQLYSTAGTCGTTSVPTASTSGTTVGGSTMTIGTFGELLSIVVAGIDNWDSGDDYWRFSVGGCSPAGDCHFSTAVSVDAEATVMSSAGVGLGNFDLAPPADLILSGIDNWGAGPDYWRYRIGLGCANPFSCSWSPIRTVESGATTLTGGGLAVASLDSNPLPDVVLAGIDSWDGGDDYWRYRIGMNCNAAGDCDWTPVQTVDAGAEVLTGGGVAVADLDRDGQQEIVISGIDTAGNRDDFWRYRIGSACDTGTGLCAWAPAQAVSATGNLPMSLCGAPTGTLISNFAPTLRGGGVIVAHLIPDGGGDPQVILSAVDTLAGHDFWRHTIGSNCNVASGSCAWTPARITSSGAEVLEGGGLGVLDVNNDGTLDLVLSGIDQWSAGPDSWRVRFRVNPCTP